jgi:large subunit ribosomal protein L19
MNSDLVNKFSSTPVNIEARKKLEIKAGDTVRVWVRVLEDVVKQKFRLQAFEGLVLAVKHGTSASATFTVRRVASGVGVERVFPLFSPTISEIEFVKRAQVRRAKLYYVREKAVREVRRKMKKTIIGGGSSSDFETVAE